MPNEFSVRLVPAKMAGVVSPMGGGGGGGGKYRIVEKFDFASKRVEEGAVMQGGFLWWDPGVGCSNGLL